MTICLGVLCGDSKTLVVAADRMITAGDVEFEQNGVDRRNAIIRNFLLQAPAHDFHCDYHLCQKWGLKVAEMTTAESDLAKGITTTLDELTDAGVICPRISGHRRLPFFKLYLYTPEPAVVESAGTQAATLETEGAQS